MSDSAIRHLKLIVSYEADAAEAASKKHHAAESARIKQTAKEQAAADAAYIKAVKGRLAAEKELEREKLRAIKAAAKAQADAARESAKAAAAAAKARLAAEKEVNATIRQVRKDADKALADATKAQLRADKEAAKERQRFDRDLNATLRQSEKETAREREGLNRQLNALLKQTARDEIKAAKDAAREKIAADKAAFRAWREEADQKHRLAMQAWAEEQKAAEENKAAITGVVTAIAGIGTAKMIIGAFAEVLGEASAHAHEVADEFIKVRQSMQEIATLSGKANDNQFTIDVAQEARSAHLRPEELKQFKSEYLNFAGSQVSNDEKLGPGQKLTKSQSDRLQLRAAEFFKASGVDPAAGAELLGSMLTQSEGPQDPEKLMERLGVAFKLLERGQVNLGKGARELGQVMAKGVEIEDAAEMYAIVSPAGTGREGTTTQRGIDAIRRLKNNGKGEQFGIKEGMSDIDSARAFGNAIEEKRKQLVAGGLTEQQAADRINKELFEEKIVPNIQEARGLVGGFGRMGTRLGGFERFDAFRKETSKDYIRQKIADYEGSDAGKYAHDEADAEVARLERGKVNAPIVEERQRAKTELEREGRFERIEASDAVRYGVAQFGSSRQDQLINERAIQNAERRAGIRGTPTLGSGNSEANERIMRALERIEENTRKQSEAMSKFIAANPAIAAGIGVAPLVAMPRPAGR